MIKIIKINRNKQIYDEADEYKKILDFYINNYEKIIMRKKS